VIAVALAGTVDALDNDVAGVVIAVDLAGIVDGLDNNGLRRRARQRRCRRGDRRGPSFIGNNGRGRGDRRGPSFIGSTTAGAVIAVNLAGVVDARDSDGLER
jgi:hypothetical protein